MRFKVWDEDNSEEAYAAVLEAGDPCDAAIAYADQDSDGLCDGLYTKNGNPLDGLSEGHPILVRDEAGDLHRYKVGIIEFEPIFDAALVSTLPAGTHPLPCVRVGMRITNRASPDGLIFNVLRVELAGENPIAVLRTKDGLISRELPKQAVCAQYRLVDSFDLLGG